MNTVSFIDQPVRLAELFEAELLAELCTAHADLDGVGIKVFDRDGATLVDVSRDGELTAYLMEFPAARKALVGLVSALKRTELDRGEWAVRQDTLSGAHYLVLPVSYEFETLGKVVMGPYLTPESPARHEPPGPLGAQVDPDRLGMLRDALPRYTDDAVLQRGEVLVKAIDIVCHAGYKSLLTSNVHLESITGAYDDLQRAHAELERSNARLRASNVRLRELDQLKSNFLATVSHELRTPLTSVIGYSEMMLEGLAGPLTDEQREYLRTIMERGESLLALISTILDIARIEHGAATTLDHQEVEPRTLVEAALSMVRPQAAKGQVRLEQRLADALPAVQVDRAKIAQVLINLLGNAVKFTPPGGRVVVFADPATLPAPEGGEQPAVRFQVQDTGIGIPFDHHERIFEAFYQVDNSSTREYGGTGLGLSIVKSFVESHGGAVGVESEPGRGAIFTVVLPVKAAEGR